MVPQQLQSLGLQGLQRTDGVAVDPETNDLYVPIFGSQDEVLVYRQGGVNPIRSLSHSDGADALTIGKIGKTEYVFVPESYHNDVHVFKRGSHRLTTTIATPNAVYPEGVAVKPAGVL